MERCWADDPGERPPFSVIVRELRQMVAALRPRSGSSRASSSKLSAAASLPAAAPSSRPPVA